MHLILDYGTLGSKPGRRSAALKLLLSLVNHSVDKVWALASSWDETDLKDLLVHTGLEDSIQWRTGVPFVTKTWDGYVLTNTDLLLQDLLCDQRPSDDSEPLHPAEYPARVKAAILAGFRVWEETVTHDKE